MLTFALVLLVVLFTVLAFDARASFIGPLKQRSLKVPQSPPRRV